jgi:phage repressor protein C with HTH and peptisase S24 domain
MLCVANTLPRMGIEYKKDIKPDMARLYDIVNLLHPDFTYKADLARLLNTSEQVISNWEARGISDKGLFDACQRIPGLSAAWIKKGTGQKFTYKNEQVHTDVLEVDDKKITITGFGNPLNRRAEDFTYKIPHYRDVIGSMGRGIVLAGQTGQITLMEATEEWLNLNLPKHSGKNNLCVVTGFGDSMSGLFKSGDPIIIDAGIKSCDHDGVYFFRVGEEGYIKRLQRIPGEGIRVISENKKYESWTIREGMDFEVFGVVLKVWQNTELG